MGDNGDFMVGDVEFGDSFCGGDDFAIGIGGVENSDVFVAVCAFARDMQIGGDGDAVFDGEGEERGGGGGGFGEEARGLERFAGEGGGERFALAHYSLDYGIFLRGEAGELVED